MAAGVPVMGVPCSAEAAASREVARSREASPEIEPDCVPTKTVPSARCSPGQASGSTVAMVAPAGAPSGACPFAKVTVAVADGRISRIATQSVSPGRPSNGRATNGAGSTRVVAEPWSAPLRRREALPMPTTLFGSAPPLRHSFVGAVQEVVAEPVSG